MDDAVSTLISTVVATTGTVPLARWLWSLKQRHVAASTRTNWLVLAAIALAGSAIVVYVSMLALEP